MDLFIYADGASKGNPGDAGVGVVMQEHSKTVREISEYIGHATAPESEYMAIIRGLQEAVVMGADRISVYCDSSVVVKCIREEMRPHAPAEMVLLNEALGLFGNFRAVRVNWMHRDKNARADALATQAVEKHRDAEIDAGFYSNLHLGFLVRGLPEGAMLKRTETGWSVELPRLGLDSLQATGERPEVAIKSLMAEYARLSSANKRESIQKPSGRQRRAAIASAEQADDGAGDSRRITPAGIRALGLAVASEQERGAVEPMGAAGTQKAF